MTHFITGVLVGTPTIGGTIFVTRHLQGVLSKGESVSGVLSQTAVKIEYDIATFEDIDMVMKKVISDG